LRQSGCAGHGGGSEEKVAALHNRIVLLIEDKGQYRSLWGAEWRGPAIVAARQKPANLFVAGWSLSGPSAKWGTFAARLQ
jgi:hypothetical protein